MTVKTSDDLYLANTVFMAIGTMAAPRTLGVSIEESISHLVQYDIQKITNDQKKILVVGGGDSAGEYAKILVDRGHDVTLCYRGNTFSKMATANSENILNLINLEQLNFYPSSNIRMIENVDGKPYVHFKETLQSESFDTIVTALGTERPVNYLTNLGITMGHEGHDIFSESSLEGVFFVGDLASGKRGGTINIAFNSGARALKEACTSYIDCV